MARKPTPLIETMFRFLGWSEGYREARKFADETGKALDEVADKAAIVTSGLGDSVAAASKVGTKQIKEAVADTIGPNGLGKIALSTTGGIFSGIAVAARAAFAPVQRLYRVTRGILSFAGKGLSLGYEGIKKIGKWGTEAGSFLVDKFKQAVLAGTGLATALGAQLVSTAKNLAGIGEQAEYTGLSPERFSLLSSMVGDADKASKALRTFRETYAAAFDNPDSEQGKLLGTFQQFGVQLSDETGQLRDASDVLNQVRQVFSAGLFTPTQEGLIAGQLFGKEGGGALLKVLKQTDEQWNSFAQDVIDSGNLVSQQQVNLAKKVKGAWGSIWDNVRGVGNKLFNEVGGVFSQLLSGVATQIKDNGDAIVKAIVPVVHYMIGVAADLTALVFAKDKDGYQFVNRWVRALASLRDTAIATFRIFRGDDQARLENPRIAEFVDRLTNDIWPRMKALGTGLVAFVRDGFLPMLTIATSLLSATLPLLDFIGRRLQWLSEFSIGFFRELATMLRVGPQAVSADWPILKAIGENFVWIKEKAKGAWDYIAGVIKTASDWNKVRLISKKEGLVGLRRREQAGELPKLDPRFKWVPKALTAIEDIAVKVASTIKTVWSNIVETIAPHLESLGFLFLEAGKWLLEFASNLASYLKTGDVESSFAWIPKTVNIVSQLVGFLSEAYGYMTGLATSFRQFSQGIDVADERFAGLFQFLTVLQRAFGTMNSIVKDIGAALGLTGIQSQVALIALGFTKLGRLLTGVFLKVGKAIAVAIIQPLLKAIGLTALLESPKKLLAAGGFALAAGAAGSGIYHTFKEANDPNGDTSRVPGQVWDDFMKIPKMLLGAIIPQKYQDEFNGVGERDPMIDDFASETSASTRPDEYGGRIQMNPLYAGDLPDHQRAANTSSSEPSSIINVNIEGRRRASLPTTDGVAAQQFATALEELTAQDNLHSMRATPVDY